VTGREETEKPPKAFDLKERSPILPLIGEHKKETKNGRRSLDYQRKGETGERINTMENGGQGGVMKGGAFKGGARHGGGKHEDTAAKLKGQGEAIWGERRPFVCKGSEKGRAR